MGGSEPCRHFRFAVSTHGLGIAFTLAAAATACGGGGAAQPATATTLGPTPSASPASPTPSGSLPPGALRVTVAPGSSATVRVRELLAANTIQTDAVLTTNSVSGTATLLADGGFSSDSKIVVDVRTLKSDEALRDKWVELFGLQWATWPSADFTPTTAGLPRPVPANGEWSFVLVGRLHIRDVTRETSWQVTATRRGDSLVAIATTVVHWADFGVPKPQAAVTQVVSVTDDIRIELKLSGTIRGE
jgi:polyisoprenoid-binding protein YceI